MQYMSYMCLLYGEGGGDARASSDRRLLLTISRNSGLQIDISLSLSLSPSLFLSLSLPLSLFFSLPLSLSLSRNSKLLFY